MLPTSLLALVFRGSVIRVGGDRLSELFQTHVPGAPRSGDLEQTGTSRMARIEESLGISALRMIAAARCAPFWAMPLRVALAMISHAMTAIAAHKRDSSLSAPASPAAAGWRPSSGWQGPQAALLGSAGRQR